MCFAGAPDGDGRLTTAAIGGGPGPVGAPGPCCIRLPYENSFCEGGRSTSCGSGTPLGLRGGPSEGGSPDGVGVLGEMSRGSAAYALLRSMLVLGLREE